MIHWKWLITGIEEIQLFNHKVNIDFLHTHSLSSPSLYGNKIIWNFYLRLLHIMCYTMFYWYIATEYNKTFNKIR